MIIRGTRISYCGHRETHVRDCAHGSSTHLRECVRLGPTACRKHGPRVALRIAGATEADRWNSETTFDPHGANAHTIETVSSH
jgi:hypothetical protein